MKTFKQHIVEFDNPQIYCDMDGVVADFLKFTRNILGTKFKDRFWEDSHSFQRLTWAIGVA